MKLCVRNDGKLEGLGRGSPDAPPSPLLHEVKLPGLVAGGFDVARLWQKPKLPLHHEVKLLEVGSLKCYSRGHQPAVTKTSALSAGTPSQEHVQFTTVATSLLYRDQVRYHPESKSKSKCIFSRPHPGKSPTRVGVMRDANYQSGVGIFCRTPLGRPPNCLQVSSKFAAPCGFTGISLSALARVAPPGTANIGGRGERPLNWTKPVDDTINTSTPHKR